MKTLNQPLTDDQGLPVGSKNKLPPINNPPQLPTADDGVSIIKMPQSSGIAKPSNMAGRAGMAPMPGQGMKPTGPQSTIIKSDNNNKDMMKYSDYIR